MDLCSFRLSTDRLLLRTVRQDDVPALSSLMTPGISRWVAAWPYPLHTSVTADLVDKALEGARARRILPLVIVEQATNAVVGWIKLERSGQAGSRCAELGYWLAEPVQGRGYAFEAAQALLGVSFDLLDVEHIEAGAQPANEISHRLLAKLGMRKDGERPVYSPARQRWGTCLYWRLDRAPVG